MDNYKCSQEVKQATNKFNKCSERHNTHLPSLLISFRFLPSTDTSLVTSRSAAAVFKAVSSWSVASESVSDSSSQGNSLLRTWRRKTKNRKKNGQRPNGVSLEEKIIRPTKAQTTQTIDLEYLTKSDKVNSRRTIVF